MSHSPQAPIVNGNPIAPAPASISAPSNSSSTSSNISATETSNPKFPVTSPLSSSSSSLPAINGSQYSNSQKPLDTSPQLQDPNVAPSSSSASSIPTLTSTPTPEHSSVSDNKSAKPARTPSSWDPQDDILLRHLKEEKKLGWKEIASHFTNRTPNACQFRWRRLKSGVLKNASNNPAAVTPEQAAKAAKDGITAPAPPPLTTVVTPSTVASNTSSDSSQLSSGSDFMNTSKKNTKKTSLKKAIALSGTIKKPLVDGKKISKKKLQQQQQQQQNSKNRNGGTISGHVRSFSFTSPVPPNGTFNSYSLSADEKYISNNSGIQSANSQKSSVFSTILRGNHRTSFSSNTGFVVTSNIPLNNNNNNNNNNNQDNGDVNMSTSVPSITSLEANANGNSTNGQQKGNFNMYSQDGGVSHTRHGSISSVRTQNSSHASIPHNNPTPGAKDPWTPEEDELLLSKRRRELSLTELSILLPWRTEEEIVARIRRLDRRAGRSSFSITSSTGSSHHHIIHNSTARSRFRTGSMSSYTAPPPSSILHPSHHTSIHSTHFTQPYGSLTTSRNPRSSFVLVDDPVDNTSLPQISFQHHGRESRMGSISGPPPGGLHSLSRTLSISSQVSVGSNISSFSTTTGNNNLNSNHASNNNNNNSLLYSGSAVYDNDDELLSPLPQMTPITNLGKNGNTNTSNTFGFSASAAANGLVMFPLRRTLSSSSTGSVGASISAFRSQIRARSGHPTANSVSFNSNTKAAALNDNNSNSNGNNTNNNSAISSESAENTKESTPQK